jgi:hypothetical protein
MASYNIISKIEVAYKNGACCKKIVLEDLNHKCRNNRNSAMTWDNLFDIAHANAMEIMTIDEDIQFLAGQRQRGRIWLHGRS